MGSTAAQRSDVHAWPWLQCTAHACGQAAVRSVWASPAACSLWQVQASALLRFPAAKNKCSPADGHLCPPAHLASLSASTCRCMMGETISVSTMLAEVIESQVKVVDGRRPDVAERWFTPEPRAVNRSAWSEWQHAQQSTAGTAGAAGAAGAQQHQQAEPAQAAHAAASHTADAGVNGSSSAPRAWSDDFSSVMVVDYRPKPQQPAESAATLNGHANGSAVNGAAVNGAAVNGHVNGAVVNGTAVNGHVNGAAVHGSSEAAGLNGHAINGAVTSSTSTSGSGSVSGSRFADWAGSSGDLAGSSSSSSELDVPFADWAGDGSQPVYEEVLDKRLTGIEDQLSRIAGLLEMMPTGQQAASLHLQQDGAQANSAV